MAKGQESKRVINDKILNMFEGSFLYNDGKEIRIPMEENGEIIQIKCVLTASKVSVEPGSDNAIPTAAKVNNSDVTFENNIKEPEILKVTEEEKSNLVKMMQSLGL